MKRETRAAVSITRRHAQGTQTIHACADHEGATLAVLRKLGDEEPEVTAADPARHGCKGCLEDWGDVTILEVQSATFLGAWSGSLGSDVTVDDAVALWPYCYGGTAMASSAPKFGGSAVGAASELLSGQQPSGGEVYSAIWILPSLAGGAASVSLTNSGNGTVDNNVGMTAIEFSGMGAAPVIDSGAAPNPETGNGATGAVSSGSTGNITSAPELILATAVAYGQNLTGPSSPWTNTGPTGLCVAGWRVVTSSGGAYDYAAGSAATAGWFAGVVAVKPGSGGTARTAAAPSAVPAFLSMNL